MLHENFLTVLLPFKSLVVFAVLWITFLKVVSSFKCICSSYLACEAEIWPYLLFGLYECFLQKTKIQILNIDKYLINIWCLGSIN